MVIANGPPTISLPVMITVPHQPFQSAIASIVFGLSLLVPHLHAEQTDWPQFRGTRDGRSDSAVPTERNDTTNILWKTDLPGPGASSPVVLGNRIWLTCHTGFATGSGQSGDISQLKRHLLCLNLADGKIAWNTAVPAEMPEQERIREDHGYASSTPVVDADRIYTFFGKSGVFAFDHDGKQIWNTKVGDKLNGWGSATSPILYKDFVIINASVESQSVVALDKKTGREIWRTGGINDSWHAPVLAEAPGGKTELVIAMLKKILAFDPDTGSPLWNCDTSINWYICPMPIAENGIIYSIGGRNPNGSLAVRAGGRGDVTSTHLIWKLNKGSNVPSPILHEEHLYFAHENLGIVYCVNAKTGALVYEERLEPSPGQIYASPILADGRIYFTGRTGRTVVIAAKPTFNLLAHSTLESNRGVFNSSPAIVGNRLLLRSNRALYAIAETR